MSQRSAYTIKNIIIVSVLCVLAGCATKPSQPVQVAPPDAPVSGRAMNYFNAMPASEGSLWTESGDMLFMDRRARRVGDTVIVDIVENTSSQMDANTKTSRETTLTADVAGLTGYKNIYKTLSDDILFDSTLTSEFDGKGSSDRSGSITASIGARVTEVLPNGNIVVYGRRDMKVNNENQTITVFGIVRPEDVGSDNHVQSTYLADSRIEYIGKGALADRQRPGWGMRIVDKLWPF